MCIGIGAHVLHVRSEIEQFSKELPIVKWPSTNNFATRLKKKNVNNVKVTAKVIS